MRLTKHKADAVNRMGVRLRDTLKRCDEELPASLRLMAVQLVKESISKGYLGHSEIHPGIDKLAKWGRCGRRQAQRNIRTLEQWGVAIPTSFQKGGRRATRYWVEPEALIREMMDREANPHPDLMSEIRDHVKAVRGDIRDDMRGVTWRDTCHPVSRRDTNHPRKQDGCGTDREGGQ